MMNIGPTHWRLVTRIVVIHFDRWFFTTYLVVSSLPLQVIAAKSLPCGRVVHGPEACRSDRDTLLQGFEAGRIRPQTCPVRKGLFISSSMLLSNAALRRASSDRHLNLETWYILVHK